MESVKNIKRISTILFAAIFTLCLGMLSDVSAESLSNDNLLLESWNSTAVVSENSRILGRNAFGLSTESSTIDSLKSKNYYSNKYIIYLSPDEEAQLEKRFQTQTRVIPKLKEDILAKIGQDNFIGMYIDQKNGGVVNIGIRTGASVKTVKNSILSSYNSELPIKFYQAKYSESDLDHIMDKINKNVEFLNKQINIQYTNVDFVNQKNVVGIEENTPVLEALKVLSDLTKQEESLFQIEYIDATYKTSEDARYTTQSPILDGLVIVDSPGTTGACSVGFSAIDSNSTPYIITAAHCWNTSGIGIYQGNDYIGHVSRNSHYGNNADAVAIALTSNNLLSNKIYGTTRLLSNIQVAGNDVLGERICKSGMWGDSCGILLGKNKSGYWGEPSTWFDNLRVANYISDDGDSGGTIYNGNTIKGVHKGTYTDNGTTYRVYSHVTNVASRLNITPVNWLNR